MERESYNNNTSLDSLKIKKFDSEQEIYQCNGQFAGNYNHEQNLNQNQIEPNNIGSNSISPLEDQQTYSQLMMLEQQNKNNNFVKDDDNNNDYEDDQPNNQGPQKIYFEYEENLIRNPFISSSQNSINNSNNNFNSRQRNENQNYRSEEGRNIGGQISPPEVLEEDDENVSFGEQSPLRNKNNQFFNRHANTSPQSSHLVQNYQNDSRPDRISFPFQIPSRSTDYLGEEENRRGSGGIGIISEAQLFARDSIRNVDSVTERIPISKEQQEANQENNMNNKQIPFLKQQYTSPDGCVYPDNQFQKLIRMHTCPGDERNSLINNGMPLYNHRLSNELYVSEYKNQAGTYVRKNSDGTDQYPQISPREGQSNNQQDDNQNKRKNTADKKQQNINQQQGKKESKINLTLQNKTNQQGNDFLGDGEMKCQITEHDGEKVIMICTDPYCEAKYRLCCGYCNQLHSKHIKSLIRLQEYRFQILQSSKILDQPELEQNQKGKEIDSNKINHKELLYLCMQKQNQLFLDLKKYLDNTFMQIQKLVEDKEKQILTYISSFDEEYNYYSEKLQLLKQKNYESLNNKDILKLFTFQKQPQKFLEHQRINNKYRKKQLSELDEIVYDYYVNLQDIFDNSMTQSDNLLYELLQKLTSNNYHQNSNQSTSLADRSNSFNTPTKTNKQNENSSSPLKKFISRAASSLLKQNNNHLMEKGIPGYKRLNELPQWCSQMQHVSRTLKKFGAIKFEKIKPNTINLGIQQNIKSENIYIGDWINYMKEGNGIEYSKKDQTYYEGEWRANQKHGNGRLISKNDLVYEGQFENNKKGGFGILYQFGGKRYEGMWQNDQPNGRGMQYYPNGDIFTGEFKNGLKQGEGVYKYFDGTILTGLWEQDHANGQCKYNKLDGSSYEGEYKLGKKDGYGTYTWNDGRKYTGQWLNGVQNGMGFYTNHIGITVQGYWKNGRKIQQNDSEFTKSIIK